MALDNGISRSRWVIRRSPSRLLRSQRPLNSGRIPADSRLKRMLLLPGVVELMAGVAGESLSSSVRPQRGKYV